MEHEHWGHCPTCVRWFFITDPAHETHVLCPVCMTAADQRRRTAN